MKIAVMQPYLFPYAGYFQLIAVVDKFVFYDDVNFIKNGWINRNRLFLASDVRYFTVPLLGASPFKKINEVAVVPGNVWQKRIIDTVRQSYSKAPFFKEVNSLVSEIIFLNENKIGNLAKTSVMAVCNYLDINTQFVMTSAAYENSDMSGAARIIDICHREKSQLYFNLSGGKNLYSKDSFESENIELNFVGNEPIRYQQLSNEFHSGLSIIDVLMFNDKKTVSEMLRPKITPQ
jgi:hypothetical protein